MSKHCAMWYSTFSNVSFKYSIITCHLGKFPCCTNDVVRCHRQGCNIKWCGECILQKHSRTHYRTSTNLNHAILPGYPECPKFLTGQNAFCCRCFHSLKVQIQIICQVISSNQCPDDGHLKYLQIMTRKLVFVLYI